ncbi:DUF6087 family protein [Kitasatospora sp. NPDC056138]|uniref:DUF6087 family protein n=1 Tax=Kitasatospora sp. NPDC056138 TaxID=3345724 RepID=UPI0035DFD597
MDEDEPLELWAARRDAVRRPLGDLTALMLDGSPATHTRPTEPRMVMEWDGVQWLLHAVADNYAAAQRILHGIKGDGVMRQMMPQTSPHKAAGRHRKP